MARETMLQSPVLAKYLTDGAINAYAKDLRAWFDKNDAWELAGFADHFAIKVEDRAAFDRAVEAVRPYCKAHAGATPGLSMRKMQDRLIAVALLKEPLRIGFLAVDCIEIMQPQPQYEGKDTIGLDHLEFVHRAFGDVLDAIERKNIRHEVDMKNAYKRVVWSQINDRWERVKFTDKTLAEIVPLQIRDDPALVEILVSAPGSGAA